MARTTLAATAMAAILTAGAALPAHAHTTPAQPDTVSAAQADTTANNTRTWAEESSAWAEGTHWITNDLSSDFPFSIVRWISAAASVPLVFLLIEYLRYWNKRNNELAAGIGR